jgi:hypothetical protein
MYCTVPSEISVQSDIVAHAHLILARQGPAYALNLTEQDIGTKGIVLALSLDKLDLGLPKGLVIRSHSKVGLQFITT